MAVADTPPAGKLTQEQHFRIQQVKVLTSDMKQPLTMGGKQFVHSLDADPGASQRITPFPLGVAMNLTSPTNFAGDCE